MCERARDRVHLISPCMRRSAKPERLYRLQKSPEPKGHQLMRRKSWHALARSATGRGRSIGSTRAWREDRSES